MQSQPASHPTHDDDEISLLELWEILAGRKWLIFISFAVCVGVGAAYAFIKAPVYQASTLLRVGQFSVNPGQPVLLENINELTSRVMAAHGENISQGVNRPRPFITQAAVERGSTTTLQLTAEADTPEQAAQFLQEVVAEVQRTHATNFQANLTLINERLRTLEERRSALQKQYDEITQLIEQLKERNPVQASLVMMERGPLSNTINELDAERLRLSQQLGPLQSRPTVLLGEIVAPTQPSEPKKALVLAIAALLGLMGGVMLAFGLEFVAKAKASKPKA
ncbi:Wzz/FepE/Etk N-terminal domain-containing protein [Serpentinimonas barnesii]|uniref:Wzz/FepE/Etk N-terminal domain-containing protein n=1 Tax=Serpentinimonas barnesii TaxID=1458427 RepID=UPI0004982997|nr:Wzz/FepE/Etk N-terminal domain-containing protein [Serpentinimonas barnesii]